MAALATRQNADEQCSPGEEDQSDVFQPCTSVSPGTNHCGDDKQARQKAADFFREAEKNRRLIEKLEKERPLIVQCGKNGWTDLSAELEEFEKVLDGERKAEKANFKKQLSKVQNGVRRFQTQLTDVKPTPELIEKLKEIMSEVEISINTLKEEQRTKFEELLKEERTYRQELTAYEKKIENWTLTVKTDSRLPTATNVKTKLQDRDLPAEVRALESFLNKTGGSCGGWDQYDHQAFLKVWTKYRGQPAYRAEAKLYLPSKTMEDIERHEDWYKELIYLQDKKREVIQRWKSSKQRERESKIQSLDEAEEAKRREAKIQAQQQRAEEERKAAAQQLEKWKKEKQIKEEEEERQRQAEEIQKERRAKEERRRQLEVKLIIEEQLRLKREEEEEQQRKKREEEMREMDERRREATKGIKQFNERDLHKVEAKLHEKQLRRQQEEERQRRITVKLKEKMDGQVSRDPSRLTRPTKGWEERMKHVGASGGGPVLQMFHRAVPTWRQGL